MRLLPSLCLAAAVFSSVVGLLVCAALACYTLKFSPLLPSLPFSKRERTLRTVLVHL